LPTWSGYGDLMDRLQRDRTLGQGLLYVFMAAALVLRVPGHLNSGLWFDEIVLLVDSIRVPFGSLFTTFESDNNHPLYSVSAWLSVHFFGEQAWTLRLPAVVFGVASIGAMWRLASLVATRAEAVLATGLLTVSYHHVWFSQNARGYTMLLFWALTATYFLLKTYAGGGRRTWIPYALSLALATSSHASAVLLAVAHGLVSVAVIASSPRSNARRWEERWASLLGLTLAGLLSLLLHAGMIGDMLLVLKEGAASGLVPKGAGPPDSALFWWTLSAVVESLGIPVVLGWGALAAGGSLVTVGTLVYLRRDWRQALLFLLPAVISVVVTEALGRSLRPRFLFFLSGFGLLIVVAGVFAICEWTARLAPVNRPKELQRRLERAAAALMILASLAILPRAYNLPKQDFEGALEYVRAVPDDATVVATVGLAIVPYRDYYEAGFSEITSPEELDRLLSDNASVYVLHTLPLYLEKAAPALASRLAGAEEVARFRGSLGDGDVVVLRFKGNPSGS
jgi:mannosyltransferase